MATAAARLTAESLLGGEIAGQVGGWSSMGGWMVLVLVAVPVVGRVVVVWLALRNTTPRDRPRIIAALADLLRPPGRFRRDPAE